MRTKVVVVGISVILGLGASGCAGQDGQRYRSAAALVGDLQMHGHPCSRLKSAPPLPKPDPDVGPHLSLVRDQASCDLDRARLDVFVFAGEKQRDDWLLLAGRLGPSIVLGPDWAVMTSDVGAANTVASSLGGKLDSAG